MSNKPRMMLSNVASLAAELLERSERYEHAFNLHVDTDAMRSAERMLLELLQNIETEVNTE